MTDFSPSSLPSNQFQSTHRTRSPPPPLPTSSKLAQLRRRLTFTSSDSISLSPSHTRSDNGKASAVTRIKGWMSRRTISRKWRNHLGPEELIDDDVMEESFISRAESMIMIPGRHSPNQNSPSSTARIPPDPFAHPSPAFQPQKTFKPLTPPETLRSNLPNFNDYSITSPTTRRNVAAATRSITLASRINPSPSLSTSFDNSYQVHSDASFASMGSSIPGRGLLAPRNSKVPNNTPIRGHVRFSNVDEYLTNPISFIPTDSRTQQMTSRGVKPMREITLNLNHLPPPRLNSEPRWNRLKYILQAADRSNPGNSSPNVSPAPLLPRDTAPPNTPPLSPSIPDQTPSPLSSLGSPLTFNPNPLSASTPASSSMKYHLSLPDFSSFDWTEEPSHITRSTDLSFSDGDHQAFKIDLSPALDALWSYDSEDEEIVSPEWIPRREEVAVEKNPTNDESEVKTTDPPLPFTTSPADSSSASAASSVPLSMVQEFPLPPDWDTPSVQQTSITKGVQLGTKKLLPSKFRPELARAHSTPILEGDFMFGSMI